MPVVFSPEGEQFDVPQDVLDRYALSKSDLLDEATLLDGQLIVQVFWLEKKGEA